ncbi:MAG: hypothetical protein AAF065_06140 [Verrucomicrobiota bacterium]
MKTFFTICTLIATSCFLQALSVVDRSLEEVIQDAELIVVGYIESYEGREKSKIGGPKYDWRAELVITKTLKQPIKANKKISIRWLELHTEKEYEAKTLQIWILEKTRGNDYYFVAIPHGTYPLSHEAEILEHITSR